MTQETKPERMQCMDVWGGNRPVQRAVALTGLNLWVYSQPVAGAEAGGDVHYVSSCGSGRVARVLLADVSGHGTRVAELAESLRGLMQRYVNYIDQSAMVRRMNERFNEWVGEGFFATALVGTFFAPTRHFTISNAGHPPPFLYRRERATWTCLEQGGQDVGVRNTPLGAVQHVPYKSFTVRMDPGDLMLWYTDSLIDFPVENGTILGTHNLLSILNGTDVIEPEKFLPRLLERISHEFGVAPYQRDDLTLLLMQCTGEGSQAPLIYQLKGILRFFKKSMCKKSDTKDPIPWPEISIPNVLGAFIPFFNKFWKPPST